MWTTSAVGMVTAIVWWMIGFVLLILTSRWKAHKIYGYLSAALSVCLGFSFALDSERIALVAATVLLGQVLGAGIRLIGGES